MSGPRALAKGLADAMLGSPVALRAMRVRLRGARLVLAYHNVVAGAEPPTYGDRSLHLPLARFRAQLDALQRHGFAVVRLDAPRRADAPPEVAITFDDACAGAIALGLPELTARRMPATVMVAPGLLGAAAPWWDRLADPRIGAVPAAYRDPALQRLAGETTAIMAEAARAGWPVHDARPEHRIATEAELADALARHPDLTLGAHTWSHPNVAALPAARLDEELRKPLEWLRARWGERVVDWFAFPYGLSSPAAAAAARAAGYAGALRVEGGWERERLDPWAVPRFNVTPGLSVAGFRSRLSGLR